MPNLQIGFYQVVPIFDYELEMMLTGALGCAQGVLA
jgi:hypothetical protein